MADYRETTVTGKTWRRCKTVWCQNPYEGVREIRFMEEDVATLADAVFLTDAGGVAQTFTDDSAETEFTLVHPLTGDVMGTAQYQQLYLMLHSLYLHVAAERDAAEALFMPTPVTEPEV